MFKAISFFTIICFLISNSLQCVSQNLTLDWVASLGSTTGDQAKAVSIDDNGNVYYTGSFTGTVDFDPDTGVYNLSGPNNSLFLCKLDRLGEFEWAFATGREGTGNDVLVDDQSNVYIAGHFKGSHDFDPSPNVAQLQAGSLISGFIAKYDNFGNYIWAKMIGNQFNTNEITSITIDNSHNLYLSGRFFGNTDFDPDTSSYLMQSAGGSDAFILKLDSNGVFQWSSQIGGDRRDEGNNLVCVGNFIYAIGAFEDSAQTIHTSGSFNLTSNGDLDSYVSKFDSNGSLIWLKTFGGLHSDFPRAIAADKNGDLVLNGTFRGPVDFDPGPAVYNLDSGYVFTLKLDTAGNFVWANRIQTFFAATNTFGIAVDSANNIYNVGGFNGVADFDPGIGVANLQSSQGNLFLQKLDANGQFQFAIKQNRTSIYNDIRNSITVDSKSDIYLVGEFRDSVDFDPDTTVELRVSASSNWPDLFVQKLSQKILVTSNNETILSKAYPELRVYPNPNDGNFSLSLPNKTGTYEVIIYNNLGQLVLSKALSQGEERLKLNLKNGNYLIKVISQKGIFENKFIINR